MANYLDGAEGGKHNSDNIETNFNKVDAQKQEIINKIQAIIEKYGTFHIGEVEGANGICVNEMGKFVGVAEYFNSTAIEVNIYEPSSFSSDEIDSYELTYDELTIEVLEEILFVADLYETDQEKTLKRIS